MRVVDGYTLFFSERDALSNWYRSNFNIKGFQFNSVEQFMIYCKARLFDDTQTAVAIMQGTHPREHKALGRKVAGYDDAVWRERRLRIVMHGCYAKFSQSPSLAKILLATGDTVLVEASPYDVIWGVGLGENDLNITNPERWRGENLLGNVLMATRERLTDELSARSSMTQPCNAPRSRRGLRMG